jgi:hypothetical protein
MQPWGGFCRTFFMRRLTTTVCLAFLLRPASFIRAQGATEPSIRQALISHATPLHDSGEALILKEAGRNQYVLLGELHGENEVPQLISDLWPALWQEGYRHIAAEVSPWAATHLQKSVAEDTTPVPGLWTRNQAADVNRFAAPDQPVVWGCDIEEEQPNRLIQQMATLNPSNASLHAMAEIVSHGYNRKRAPELLQMAKSAAPTHDVVAGGESLWKSTLDTLQVESLRAGPGTRYFASDERERVMKNQFLVHLKQQPQGNVLLRFGRNHLHRGLDARGISTLGNFVAEWAVSQGQSVVNIGVFAAGGNEHLAGQTFSADERQDESTFALLASLSGNQPTLFDLRDLRPILHGIPSQKRTPLETNLVYWADSYDFLLCYPSVSPLTDLSADPR